MFTAFAIALVLIAGLAIMGRTRSRAMPRRESDAFDSGPSYMWFGDSGGSGSSDCSPSDAGCDGGGGGGSDGGGGGGGSD